MAYESIHLNYRSDGANQAFFSGVNKGREVWGAHLEAGSLRPFCKGNDFISLGKAKLTQALQSIDERAPLQAA